MNRLTHVWVQGLEEALATLDTNTHPFVIVSSLVDLTERNT